MSSLRSCVLGASVLLLLSPAPIASASLVGTPRLDATPRHVAWWRPVGCSANTTCQASTLASLKRRFGAWDTFSPTVARVYNGSAAIDLTPLSADVAAAMAAAKEIGYRVVPMLEVDCGKVVGNANSSADYAPAISALASLAKTHHFDGYTLDMICGDLRATINTTTRRFVDFVDTLHSELSLQGNSTEVNWFAHGGYHPDAAEPNAGDACFSEDTYRCERLEWTLEGVRGWVGLLKAHAGIGLEPSPHVYFETDALHTLFSSLYKLGVRSVGTWGTIEGNTYREEWDFAMRQYILGNYTQE